MPKRGHLRFIYQELNLVSEMDIAENIYLNAWADEIRRDRFQFHVLQQANL
jgi:ABC-type sugar transport system ATPase subunit